MLTARIIFLAFQAFAKQDWEYSESECDRYNANTNAFNKAKVNKR